MIEIFNMMPKSHPNIYFNSANPHSLLALLPKNNL